MKFTSETHQLKYLSDIKTQQFHVAPTGYLHFAVV